MDVVLGRDPNSGRLKVSCNGKDMLLGEPGSVDNTVSRQHCQLNISETGDKTLINLNPDNETILNGQFIVRKKFVLDEKTVINLGFNNYVLNLKAVLKAIGYKETYSIGHLKKVIEDYRAMKLKMQIDERKQNALRGFTPVLGSLALILGFMDIDVAVRITLMVVSLSLTCYFGYAGFLAASKNPQKHAQLDKDYHTKCVCPNKDCGHFLPGEYDDIIKSGVCPYCHSRFKE